jgi:hypothetical protein
MSQTNEAVPSESTPVRSRRMALVAEREVPDQPAPPSSPPTTTSQPLDGLIRELGDRQAWRASLLGTLNALTAVLAVRLVLMLATIGAIILAVLALRTGQTTALAVLGIYALAVVCPLVWLSSR